MKKTAQEIYRNVHASHGVPGGNADRYDLEAMEEFADQYKSKWISVNERLPELGTRVEVYSDRDGNNFATYNTDNVWGRKDQKGNSIPCFLDEQDEQPGYWIVTHWRLPEIPE